MSLSYSVLVVEDHDFQRRVLVRMLRALGAETVLEAPDGRAALTLLVEGAVPGLVICDLDMPEMDGMALIRHLGRTLPDVAVIVVSALSPSVLASVAKMADAYGVRIIGALEKPVTRARLSKLLSDVDTLPRRGRAAQRANRYQFGGRHDPEQALSTAGRRGRVIRTRPQSAVGNACCFIAPMPHVVRSRRASAARIRSASDSPATNAAARCCSHRCTRRSPGPPRRGS